MPNLLPDDKLAMLGRGVRAVVGTKLQTVFLTDYHVGSGTFNGFSINGQGKVIPLIGLTRYPDAERPDRTLQFVLPGEDEQVLVKIGG